MRTPSVSTPCNSWNALVGDRQAPKSQTFGARAHDEGGGAELLVEDDAVIATIGLGQHAEFSG